MDNIINLESYQNNIRKDVINAIIKNKIKPQNILELGGGGGFTSSYLCKKYNCKATNIDINIPENKSSNVKHIQLDISKEKIKSSVEKENFNLVLALDVVEHIVNTQKLINSILEICSKGTYLFLSMPNIKNLRVPYEIYIKNSFPRKEQGIFDQTHLRWFTKNDINNLLKDNGFKLIKSYYTDHRSVLVNNRFIEKIFGSLFAPQFLVIGKF